MSLVAPQDNTLVMYYNSNAALSGWTLALQILNLIFLLASKQQKTLLQSRGGHLPGPLAALPSPPSLTFSERDGWASRAARAVKREKQEEGVLSCALPLGQKASLPLPQQNTTDLLFNSKLSPQIKRGKEKLFFLLLH